MRAQFKFAEYYSYDGAQYEYQIMLCSEIPRYVTVLLAVTLKNVLKFQAGTVVASYVTGEDLLF